MNVVDSSGWLEYFANGPQAALFAKVLRRPDQLIVPVISVYEVFKRVLQQRDESAALEAVALMEQGRVVPLDTSIAMAAAKISQDFKLAMADSIILATTWEHSAILWTQDIDFSGMASVKYIEKVHSL